MRGQGSLPGRVCSSDVTVQKGVLHDSMLTDLLKIRTSEEKQMVICVITAVISYSVHIAGYLLLVQFYKRFGLHFICDCRILQSNP